MSSASELILKNMVIGKSRGFQQSKFIFNDQKERIS